MELTTFLILALIVGLLAPMTADVILDCQTIWNNAGQIQVVTETEVKAVKTADISWVQQVEDSQESEPGIDIIELAKSCQVPKLPKPGDNLWANLDAQFEQYKDLGLDYSSLTVKQLKGIAKERAIPKYKNMRKAELIAALQSQ